MNVLGTRVLSAAAAAALALVWLVGLKIAHTQNNRMSEPPPGTRRRLVGALLGLTFAPLPLLAWVVPTDNGEGLMLAGVIVVTQQLAGWLTFSGALAAWRRVDLDEPPPAPPGSEDAAATAR